MSSRSKRREVVVKIACILLKPEVGRKRPNVDLSLARIASARLRLASDGRKPMNPTIRRPVGRLALALGLVVGAWLIPSTSTSGAETAMPARTATAVAGPNLIQLAQADTASTERPVSYAADQADRGKKKYEKECLECHGKDLKGGLNGGAPIRGVNFTTKFADGAPASALFVYMSDLMPPNSPGRYSPNTYADLMAYVLKRNGFKAGAPLPSDLDALDYLIMEK